MTPCVTGRGARWARVGNSGRPVPASPLHLPGLPHGRSHGTARHGAVVALGARTLVDMPTVLIALASLAILLRFRVPAPLVVTAEGIAGLVVSPFCMEACDGACIMHPSQSAGFAERPTLRCSRPVPILTSASQEAQWLRYTRACTRSQHIGTLFMVSPCIC